MTSSPRSNRPGSTPQSARDAGPRRGTTAIAAAAAVATLAAIASFNGSKARQAERATPPVGDFVEVGGVRLHYLERGTGKPIVFLHGNGATLQDFIVSGAVDRAAERYRVIAFDRPGFGYSGRPRSTIWSPAEQAEVIHKALIKLGMGRPIVVSHSWGTLVALALALNYPKDVAALVLLAGYYLPSARADAVLFSPPALPLIGDLLRFTISPLVGRVMAPSMFKAMFSPLPVPDNIGDWPLELALRPSQIQASAADTALMVPAAAQLSTRYKELQLPIVIMAGDHDKIARFEKQSAKLHSMLPASELMTVEGAGHMVHYAAPERLQAAIDRAASLALGSAVSHGAGEDLVPETEASAF